MSDLRSFEDSFRDGAGSCRATCACGKEFYKPGPYSWESGELEGLKERGAHCMEWSPSYMTFEGSTYVLDCECWKPRALRIMAFLDGHAHKIAGYFREEKKRKAKEAESAVEIT